MLCGVIQKVHDDLRNQHCVNIDEHRLIGNGNLEVYLRVTLFEISKAFAENFLDKLGTFFDVSLLRSAYSSYRQQVFNHSHKPFGILLGIAEQNVALVRRKVIALVEHSVDRADY